MALAVLGIYVARAITEEIKNYRLTTAVISIFFFLAQHKFVKIVYDQLFHLSAVMARINGPLNTGSCEFSILLQE